MSTIKTTNIQHPSAASPAITLDAAGNLLMPGGKILQIVRATDGVSRTTTSTTYVDTSISVTITPQKNDSAIILACSLAIENIPSGSTVQIGRISITDSSNNPISGAENFRFGTADVNNLVNRMSGTVLAYATPATTSAVTYKLRFRSNNASNAFGIRGGDATTQLYAIEVSA